VQVNLYATFRSIAGVKRFTLDLPPGSPVLQAVEAVVTAYPALREHWLDEQGELHAHVHVFVNGREVPTLPQRWETLLQPNDVLDFFPPVAGG
jgi:molybdopterin synthase sulfur carrier subunit